MADRAPLLPEMGGAPGGGYGASGTRRKGDEEDRPAVAVLVAGPELSDGVETIATVLAQGGLSEHMVYQRRLEFGWNELPEVKVSYWKKLVLKFWGPMPWLIELAVILSAILEDYKDFGFLLVLLLINGLLAFYEEFKAGNAVDELKKGLARQARVHRDGEWTKLIRASWCPGT